MPYTNYRFRALTIEQLTARQRANLRNTNRVNKLLKTLLLVIVIGLVYVIGISGKSVPSINKFVCRLYAPNHTVTIRESNTIIEIPHNASLKEITNLLANKNIIPADKKDAFICFVTKNKLYPQFKSGVFVFQEGETDFQQIALRLTKPNPPIFKVVIPEGLRADQIASIWAKAFEDSPKDTFSLTRFNQYVTTPAKLAEIIDLKDFTPIQITKLKNLEGLLYPATYTIRFDATTEDVIKQHLAAFKKYALPLLSQSQPNGLTPYETLILASIIEREATGDFTEKQIIADILLRRLKAKRPLEVDATLLYPKNDWTAPITNKDKNSDSPYNTYKFVGLPPTPISNPGADSIKAVLTPKPNEYWYYLHGKDGKIRYAKTYPEHIQNIYRYLR